ncbi:MAG: hypothetical protein ABIX00_05400 [Polaromonas sp.]
MSDLKKMVGISVLLGLSQQVRDGGMNLPRPGARRDSQGSLHGDQRYLQ